MDTSTMQYILASIFGTYAPVTTEVAVTEADGTITTVTQVAAGMAGVDWPYVLGVLLFAVTLYSFFRLVGTVLKGA